MSGTAQAECEKQARITYGEAEVEAVRRFVEAARIYAAKPSALQLRAMSIIYEVLKGDKNTGIVTPSNVTESLNLVALVAAMNGESREIMPGKNAIEPGKSRFFLCAPGIPAGKSSSLLAGGELSRKYKVSPANAKF